MSLFYLGVLPHVPRMLPVLISDPVMRQKVEDTFTSQEFLDNLEGYFVDNIKVSFFHIFHNMWYMQYHSELKSEKRRLMHCFAGLKSAFVINFFKWSYPTTKARGIFKRR